MTHGTKWHNALVTALSRTERRILASRDRVVAAAWQLAMEKPWAQVTVADVCERADVVPRTFYRYFRDKTELLFADAAGHLQAVDEVLVRHRFTAADPWSYAGEVFADLALYIESFGRVKFARRAEVIASDPDLAARELLKRHDLMELAASRLAGDAGPDAARIWAGVLVAIFWEGVAQWSTGTDDLTTHVSRALDVVRHA